MSHGEAMGVVHEAHSEFSSPLGQGMPPELIWPAHTQVLDQSHEMASN